MRRYLICLLLLLSACATRQQVPAMAPIPTAPAAPAAPAIPAGKAEVHIYRRAVPLGPTVLSITVLSIYDGARPLGELPIGTYIQYYADPGPRVLKAVGRGSSSIPYATTLVAGHSYYFTVYFLGDQQSGNVSLAPVDTGKATAQMAALKPVSP